MFKFFKNKTEKSDANPAQEVRKNTDKPTNNSINTEEMIDDISYIQEIKHIKGNWQQYDVLLAARGYGWDMMVDWAAYMEQADLDNVSTITTARMANMILFIILFVIVSLEANLIIIHLFFYICSSSH